jgi:electron transfer flavoprotein alpha subunit
MLAVFPVRDGVPPVGAEETVAECAGRALLAGAVQITPTRALLARAGGLELLDVAVDGPFVATLQPGVRGVEPVAGGASESPRMDAEVIEVLPPDVATMDLGEALGRRVAVRRGGARVRAATRRCQ